MKLLLTSLDHTRADLDTRSGFAVSTDRAQRLVTALKASGQLQGCVVISTCNRTELYATAPQPEDSHLLTRLLCAELGQDYQANAELFIEKQGDQAFEHLVRVASGLDSQILGDDQIITQTREALELSRAAQATESYIETAFRLAIKAAKAIKTQVMQRAIGSTSVPQETVEQLRSMLPLPGKRAVVIGNGVIGRHVATLLAEQGVAVTVTLRQYRKGSVQVPDKVETIAYSDRYQAIAQADIVVSATTSPHLTVRAAELAALPRLPALLIDLAVPRDIDPEAGELQGTTLLTVDDISSNGRRLPPESLATIDQVIAEHIGRYNHWQAYKEGRLTAHEQKDYARQKAREAHEALGQHKQTGAEMQATNQESMDKNPQPAAQPGTPAPAQQTEAAPAAASPPPAPGKVYAVGLGPGDLAYMAPQAREAIAASDVVVGYTSYIKMIPELVEGKQVISTGMRSEAKRCQAAIDAALAGQQVAVVSSGDAGVYGMAGLLYELAEGHPELEIEVVPGITAATAAAAVLGSPLTNDFAVISLSDLLTPWEVIERRLEAASLADMVLCLYNPRSSRRSDHLRLACEISMRHKPADTYCGYVRNAFRGPGDEGAICRLDELASAPVDMLTTVIIGNSDTRLIGGKLVTTRGYQL